MPISRQDLFRRTGIVGIVEPLTKKAYEERELKIWKEDLESSPHGAAWHTSFHASSSPGDDQEACGRKAIYTLMNVPNPEPTGRFLRTVADAGMAVEAELIKRWEEMGVLLSAGIKDELQTNFKDEEHWLTGSTDAILLPYRSYTPHAVEIKTKAEDKVNEMKNFMRSYDKKHGLQCKTYIDFAHNEQKRWKKVCVCEKTWRLATNIVGGKCRIHGGDSCLIMIDLQPCVSGSIYYLSRDNPSNTHEFIFEYDPDFMRQGREKLALWRDHFLAGTLPERPQHASEKIVGWSEDPCKFCSMKRDVCKLDWKEGINNLNESNAIKLSQRHRPSYDYETTRKAVLDRWSGSNSPKK